MGSSTPLVFMVTLTIQEAVTFGLSTDLQVITAVPVFRAVTLPFLSTLAIFLFEEDQVTSVKVAFEGFIVGTKVKDVPTFLVLSS